MPYLIPVPLLGSFCLGASFIRLLTDIINNGEISPKSIILGLVGLTVLLIGLYVYNRDKEMGEMPDPIPVPLLGSFCLGVSFIMLLTDIVNNGTVSYQAIGTGVMGLLFLVIGLYVYCRDKKEGNKTEREA